MPSIDREDECLCGYKEQVEKKRAGDTIKEICPKCGQSVLDCGCRLYSNQTDWPMSGDKPRTGSEMTARFSQLKKSGTGTIFAPVDSEGHAGYGDPTLTIDLAPGAIIGGLYEIIRLIGRGGMGEVYLARQMTLNKNCALKVIPPDQLTEVAWLRFQLEAKAVAQLNHINLVRVTDLGIHEDCLPFYAMEYLEGANLAEMLAEHGPMPLEQALEIFIQVCDGVECAHRAGILHRDLKPANIMLTRTAKGKMEVKILDFGLAKLTRHDREKQSLTAVGDIFGSPSYMSPEQCGGETLDHRTDIYSIGCTLFESLTGRPPFNAQESAAVFLGHLTVNPPTLDSVTSAGTFPPEMERIMARLLRKNVDERYQSLADLKRDLELILAGSKTDDRTTGGRAKSEGAPGRVRPGMRGQVRRPANPPGPSGTSGAAAASGTGAGAAGKWLLLALLLGGFLVSSVVALGTYFTRQERPVTAAAPTAAAPTVAAPIAPAPLAEAPTVAAPTAAVEAEAQSSQLSADPLTKLAGDVEDERTFVINGNQIGTDDGVVWDHKPFYQGVVEREGRHYQLWS
ncbi:MAG: serine/threonine protein kinase, partial [Cyanobacteria bacterium SZAS LIN-2]|nr:serine/threonine protein kinase [Cyanobacteria bacterium SZAS LIN-2]